MTDKETILSLLNEFANPEKMASFFIHNATSDFLFIRPSGNPINAEGFEKMISGDVVQEKAEITMDVSLLLIELVDIKKCIDMLISIVKNLMTRLL